MQPDPNELPRLTDAYFLRTKEVVRRFGDREVTYAAFMRRPVICTPSLMADFLAPIAAERQTKFTTQLNHDQPPSPCSPHPPSPPTHPPSPPHHPTPSH